jgi:hypothetical protein
MLGVEPEEFSAQQFKSFAHHWRSYNETSMPMQAYCFHMNEVFANCWDKDEIYPLVIGHGIGGKIIPAKMVRLAESQSLE